MKYFAIIAAGLFLLGKAQASGHPLYWCNGCTPAQMQATAENAPQVALSSGYTWVGNIQSKSLKKYLTYYSSYTHETDPKCPIDAGPCSRWTTVDKSSEITAQELASFNARVSFYNESPIGWNKSIDYQIVNQANPSRAMVDLAYEKYGVSTITNGMIISRKGTTFNAVTDFPNPNKTAFDMVYQGPSQNMLFDYAKNNTKAAAFYLGFMSGMASFDVADATAIPTIEETYHFTDGSRISVVYERNGGIDRWVIVPGSAYDAQNNSIPQNLDEVAKGPNGSREIFDYRTSHDESFDRMMSQLRNMGLTVSGNGLVIACTRIAGAPSCHAYMNIP